MKLFAISGSNPAQRTDLAKKITKELKRRHRSVALVLATTAQANQEDADKTIRGNTITFKENMDLEKYLPFITEEFLILDYTLPVIPNFAADDQKDAFTFGAAKDFKDFGDLVDFIEAKAPVKMPFVFDNPCCGACSAKSCHALLAKIIQGQATPNDCVLSDQNVYVKINNTELSLVQFAQNIVRQTNAGLLSTLNGFEENAHIQIEIKPLNK